jgi:DNA repair photolyase
MRGILQACIDYRFPVHIIQKSTLVLRDLDLLQELASKTWVTVSFSICGVDEAVTGVMEPFAPTALERIEAMGTLVEAGVHAGVSYMPILPYLCDTWEAIEETVALVAEHRGEYVIPAGLTLSGPQRDHYFGILQVHWPHLVDPYDHIYPVGRSYGPVGYEINPYHRVAKVAAQYGVRVGLAAPSYPTDPIIPGQSRLDAFMRI